MADSRKYTSPVPTDYQEVEYIQSSGNGEYIDIDYTPTINTKFELDFAFVSSSYSQSDSIPVMGERSGTTASDTNKFALWVHKQNGRETLNFGSYDSGFQTGTNASLRNVTSNDKAKLYYNGTFVSGDDSATFTSGNLSIYLFALNDNGSLLSRNNVMKLYGMKLYESGTLVRDLIPCYRKADNVAGLYDAINDVFYTNQGSGSISVGSDVNAWLHSLRKLTTATEAVENPLYSDGTAITAYTLKGNTVQSGTPSPSNPVEVNGVGVRTENWFDGTLLVGFYLDINTMYTDNPNYRSFRIQGLPAGQYTVSWNIPVRLVRVYYDGVMYENAGEDLTSYTVTSSDGDIAFSFRDETSPDTPWSNSNTVMLNTGSTAKPFEPYGYKIPISSGGVTTNIYLGEVQSTRWIKEVVLTGEESGWSMSGTGLFYNLTLPDNPREMSAVVSTHFIAETDQGYVNIGHTRFGGTVQSPTQPLVFNYDNGAIGLTAFKQWLAQQYAAGTPVTVWYVLATAETAVVNEPLMKIGDYADTLSNATSIPTTEGANSITVDTTVQPSEFTATWTGWHDATVKEWDGSEWNE